MRNRSTIAKQKPALRRLAQLLVLAGLTVGVALPATAAGAESQKTPAATWSVVATLNPSQVQTAKGVLTLFGVYAFTPNLVNFSPKVLGPSVNQSAVANYVVPNDGRLHTYRLVFRLTTDVTTNTSYKFNDRTPVTVAGGDADVEFVETVQAPAPEKPAVWHSSGLRNANSDHWLFYSVTIYDQIS